MRVSGYGFVEVVRSDPGASTDSGRHEVVAIHPVPSRNTQIVGSPITSWYGRRLVTLQAEAILQAAALHKPNMESHLISSKPPDFRSRSTQPGRFRIILLINAIERRGHRSPIRDVFGHLAQRRGQSKTVSIDASVSFTGTTRTVMES